MLQENLVYGKLKEEFFVETHIRKRSGKEKKYVYYKSGDNKVKLNEKYLLEMIKDKTQNIVSDNYKELSKRQERLTEMYELGDLTRDEYVERKKRAAEEILSGAITKSKIKDINIAVEENYDISVVLNNTNTIFNYQEELQHYK